MSKQLSHDEFNRYLQQIKLENIGYTGQLKLKHASVLCIGAGGLGSPLLQYLAAAGIGTLGIVDYDHIEASNLHRQILYHEQHIGAKKAFIAKQQLLAANPYISINCYHKKLDETNVVQLLSEYDIIADCTDNFSTRYLINDYCFKLGKSYVTASVLQFSGQCTTFLGTEGPCFRCLFPAAPATAKNCNEAGVIGVLPGLLGLIQSTEIIKWILQIGDLLVGRVLVIDLLKMLFREFQLSADPDCNICASSHILSPSQVQTQKGKLKMHEHIISPSELKKILEKNTDLQLIDVRTPEKHQQFNIGGKLLPFDELPNHLAELDASKPIVTYCTSGGRSMMALQFLHSVGFNSVKSLEGGMNAWQQMIAG